MNVEVEVSDGLGGVLTSTPSSPPAPSGTPSPGTLTPEQAKHELTAIMSDEKHPMHAGYWRNDPNVMKHLDGIYAQAYGTAPAGETGISVSSETPPETSKEDAECLETLRRDWGSDYSTKMSEAQRGVLALQQQFGHDRLTELIGLALDRGLDRRQLVDLARRFGKQR